MTSTCGIITECAFPQTSCIANEIATANFYDAYKLTGLESDLNPLEVYVQMVNKAPSWVNRLLFVRNKTMQLIGLKNVGSLGGLKLTDYSETENLVGRKLDIFTIAEWKPDEMI